MTPYEKVDVWLRVLTLIGAVFAAWWTFSSYTDTKEKEFYADYWNEKMKQFQETSSVASTMATTSDLNEFNLARSRYWNLFYGELSLFEGACVKKAMVIFSKCVPHSDITDSNELPYKDLQQPSYRLTGRLRDELSKSWKTPFLELAPGESLQKCEFKPEACSTR